MTARVRTAPAARTNGRPLPARYYTWRAPRVPWTRTVITAAQREHGPPRPTCLCGEPITRRTRHARYTACPACGHRTWDGP